MKCGYGFGNLVCSLEEHGEDIEHHDTEKGVHFGSFKTQSNVESPEPWSVSDEAWVDGQRPISRRMRFM